MIHTVWIPPPPAINPLHKEEEFLGGMVGGGGKNFVLRLIIWV